MKKIVALVGVIIMMFAFAGCGSSGGDAAGPQTATATLDRDSNPIVLTVDLSDGWSVDFASGAAYLYDGPEGGDVPSVAMAMSLEKDVYEGYIKDAKDQPNYKELENAVSYTEDDGTTDYFTKVGDKAYLMVTVVKDADADAVFARFVPSVE